MTPSSTQIGITIGDPAGIGPEVTMDALASISGEIRKRCVVYGTRRVLERWNTELLSEISVIDPDCLSTASPGKPNKASAEAQVAYLETAANSAKAGKLAALVTAPISKQWARAAGFKFAGHTEFLAQRLAAPSVAMLFAGPKLRVVLATTHVALRNVGNALTREKLTTTIRLLANALIHDFHVARPKIGVLGLNPHASDSGLFGAEERDVITPVIEACQSEFGEQVTLRGPLVPDTAYRNSFDAFVAMYHDQALIPVKLIDFEESVNVTLGLPIVRTSPDHGVAYDIAGTGQARSTSMRAAIELAVMLADRRGTVQSL